MFFISILLWATRIFSVSYGMGFVAMDPARLQLVSELLMNRPRMIVGASELTARRYRPTMNELSERLIAGTPPLGIVKNTPHPFGTHLHFKNIFWYMFFSWLFRGYPIGCLNGIRRERNRVVFLRERLDTANDIINTVTDTANDIINTVTRQRDRCRHVLQCIRTVNENTMQALQDEAYTSAADLVPDADEMLADAHIDASHD